MKKFYVLTIASLIVTQAQAHAFLDDANPRVGSSVKQAPEEIRITYTEGIEPAFSHIALFDNAGQAVALGAVTRDAVNDKQVSAPIVKPLPPGHYEVRWNVVAVDTHHTNGHYTFDYQP